MKIPGLIQEELDLLAKKGIPFEIQIGGRHQKIFVNGLFAGILPIGTLQDKNPRQTLNIRSQIRRAARGITSRSSP